MIELASYPADLNPSNPTDGDPRNEGYAHLNLIKGVIKGTFPNINNQITAAPADLNNILLTLRGRDDTKTLTGFSSSVGAFTTPITDFGAMILGTPDQNTLASEISCWVNASGGTMSGGLVVPEIVLNDAGTFALQSPEGCPTVQLGEGFAVQHDKSGRIVIICGGIEVFWINAAGDVTIRGKLTTETFEE